MRVGNVRSIQEDVVGTGSGGRGGACQAKTIIR